jgi:heptose I phosphotransferase
MSRETVWQRLVRGCRRLYERPDWGRFAGPNWAERVMALAVTDRYHAKQGRSTGRLVLTSNGRQLAVYLKRHYCLPRWRGLLAALWPDVGWSPALEEWKHLEWARRRGLPVPASVAAGEYLGPWGRLQSFLAVEELTGMLPLHEAIPAAAARLDAATFGRWKATLTAEVARLTRELHTQRCFHKDLYLCHFFIPHTDTAHVPDWRGRVHLIDLHRLARHRLTWPLWQMKDLAELLYSSDVAGITIRDRVRFWRDYLGPNRRHWTVAWLRLGVLFRWRRYLRHNRRRQRGQRT